MTAPVPDVSGGGRRRVAAASLLAPLRRSTVVPVAEMSFRDKVRTVGVVGLSNAPRRKVTVDDHGTHEVAVTEHSKNDRVDVTVRPATTHKSRG